MSDARQCERGMKQEAQSRMLAAGAFTMKKMCVPVCRGCAGVRVSAGEHRSGGYQILPEPEGQTAVSPWSSEPNSAPLEK